MSKLHNVRGRITYISSHAKQENLYAVYETTDRHYWTELARFNQQEYLKSGTEGKCIEARELIIALPESFPDLYDPDRLLQLFTNRFKEKYGVECVSALHHNKRKTNYHIHLIFSEREENIIAGSRMMLVIIGGISSIFFICILPIKNNILYNKGLSPYHYHDFLVIFIFFHRKFSIRIRNVIPHFFI